MDDPLGKDNTGSQQENPVLSDSDLSKCHNIDFPVSSLVSLETQEFSSSSSAQMDSALGKDNTISQQENPALGDSDLSGGGDMDFPDDHSENMDDSTTPGEIDAGVTDGPEEVKGTIKPEGLGQIYTTPFKSSVSHSVDIKGCTPSCHSHIRMLKRQKGRQIVMAESWQKKYLEKCNNEKLLRQALQIQIAENEELKRQRQALKAVLILHSDFDAFG